MKIAVIGTGNMGTALAREIAGADHELIIGARNVDKATSLAKKIGPQVEAGGISAAIKAADLIVMALPYEANLAALKGVDASGKILVDVSNPITADFRDLAVGHTTSARGMNASPEEMLRMAASGWDRRWGNRPALTRMGPSRLVATVASASARSTGLANRFSARMIPALLITTFSRGNALTIWCAKVAMASPSVTSNVTACMAVRPAIAASS